MKSGGYDGWASLSGAFRAMDGEDERHMDVLEASPVSLAQPSYPPFLAPTSKHQLLPYKENKYLNTNHDIIFSISSITLI
jgi:hypothetical protein